MKTIIKMKLIILTFTLLFIYMNESNGQVWNTVGSGTDGNVFALAVYNSELYVAGNFSNAGGSSASNIARWDGSSWNSVGSGLSGIVNKLYVFGGDLYAGGFFTMAGGSTANRIAKWDGSSWSAVGTGIASFGVYNMTTYNSDLLITGWFTFAGGNVRNHVTAWDGSSFNQVGSGGSAGTNGACFSAYEYGGDLYLSGAFTLVEGSLTAAGIVKYNGTSYSTVGSGFVPALSTSYAMTVYNSDLIMGGSFTSASGTGASYVVNYDGSSWTSLSSGTNGFVRALEPFGSNLYVGGDFTTAGGTTVNYLGKWDGAVWSALGAGLDSSVRALTVYKGELYVGGMFTDADGTATNYIARLDTSTPSPPVASFIASKTMVCLGEQISYTDLSAQVPTNWSWTFSGGTPSTSTSQNPNVTYNSIGTYNSKLVACNGLGCDSITKINYIQVVASPTVTLAQTDVSCNGGSDGTATATPATGTAPYTFSWSNNGTSATVTGLSTGMITVTVTDLNGCTITDSIMIGEPAAMVLTTGTTKSTCGNADGSAFVAVAGGTPPYSYAWPGAITNDTSYNLVAGAYTVVVTDNNGCVDSAIATVSDLGAPTLTVTGTDVLCFGESTGTAIVSVSGGASPYSYSWSNGDTTVTASMLAIGTHSITVIDDSGCIAVSSVTINEPPQLTVSLSGDSLGNATATPAGGVSPYTYLWSNSETTQSVTGLVSGVYSVTITDSNGCTVTDSLMIHINSVYDPDVTIFDFKVYPNPTQGNLNIEISYSNYQQVRIQLYNILGEQLYYHNSQEQFGLKHRLDMTGYANGIYLLKVDVGEKTLTRKIIISR
ncbi:MAG: T9SS type A sorting domain-containing protein [Bacteroidetes bacterium]|nr:T9SS type A sorting domain-containing protein [Bacteroidota bacterium]